MTNRAAEEVESSGYIEEHPEGAHLWVCSGCGFAFDAIHHDDGAPGRYSCPQCEVARLRPVVEAARRFIHDGENNEPIVQLEKALAQAVYALDRKAEPITRRRNHGYALRYGWRWVWDYVRWRRPTAALRTIYWTLIRGWDGEACQFCGRPYPLWWAPDDLWLDLIGNRSGLCCLTCFDNRARQHGVSLQWRPEVT